MNRLALAVLLSVAACSNSDPDPVIPAWHCVAGGMGECPNASSSDQLTGPPPSTVCVWSCGTIDGETGRVTVVIDPVPIGTTGSFTCSGRVTVVPGC